MHSTLGDTATFDSRGSARGADASGRLRLSIIHHPDGRRVGQRAELGFGVHPVDRTAPLFGDQPLANRHISRAPVRVELTPERALIVDPSGTRTGVRLDGVDLAAATRVSPARLRAGAALTLARRVVLWVEWATARPGPVVPGLIGQSDPIEMLRHEIGRVAAFGVPCLVTGPTGSGKELVARGIHALSARGDGPFIPLNMAVMPAAVAPSQLFGHIQGAFTGADRSAPGAFVAADGGTLFLDEIGDCPFEVQAQLLRALDAGQVLPVGGARARSVDVRVVAATDAHLDARVTSGDFRAPLLHRLSGYVLAVPTLDARPGDVPLIFHHVLRGLLDAVGQAGPLVAEHRPWLPTELIERLVAARWPGNVRALRNVAQTLAVRAAGRERIRPDILDDRLVFEAPASTAPAVARYRAAGDISEAELLAALKAHRYRIKPTADALEVSRTTLYTLIGLSSRVRTASALGAAEIEAALAEKGTVAEAALHLGVSAHALKLRMRTLALNPRTPD